MTTPTPLTTNEELRKKLVADLRSNGVRVNDENGNMIKVIVVLIDQQIKEAVINELRGVRKTEGKRLDYVKRRLRELGVDDNPIGEHVADRDERQDGIIQFIKFHGTKPFYYRDIAEYIGYDMSTGGSAASNYIAKEMERMELAGVISIAGTLQGKKTATLTSDKQER